MRRKPTAAAVAGLAWPVIKGKHYTIFACNFNYQSAVDIGP